jgi:hypothetical protein
MSATPPIDPRFAGAQPLNYAAPVRNDLRNIAVRQKAIQFCILGYLLFGLLTAFRVVPPPLSLITLLGALASIATGAVFVFMLALALYSTAAGIILGILSLIPVLGLLVLLIVNGKATSVLRQHGIQVGLLGAKSSQIPAP